MEIKNKIATISRQTIRKEKAVIEALEAAVDDDFCEGVAAIYASEGRVVVTGIGKSALIARKIVATLNSTGTPALFMHAADAIHGDLGMIQPDDMILCLSKSGETAEIKVLVPMLKNLGHRLIGMVSRRDSYLGQQSDFVFHTPVSEEADPNNLAPTSSTTAQLVMGDAVAMSLLALRGFSPGDFAQLHPGGALGKQLYLRVSDLYVQHERPAVPSDAGLRSVIVEMTSRRLGATAVLNEQEEVLGII
ncbi:MAG: KpsF/GutQ family sugar-phosphate isomerase, partial [Bacteroidota bacterium]